MKLLLFGASGRSGQLVLNKALKDGHTVRAIVRDPSKLADSGAELVEGSPYDAATVEKAINDCDAVICTLNISRVSDNPWAKLRAPQDLISKSVQNALNTMPNAGAKRFITLSVLGVGDSKKSLPFIARVFLYMSNIKYAMQDHERQENLLKSSDTDWTIIRLPMLSESDGESEVLVNINDGTKLGRSINRDSLARFVLDILNKPEYFKKVVGVSN